MNISFKSKKLKKLFESGSALEKKYGENARYVMRRMTTLKAAPNLACVPHQPPERCHELIADRRDEFVISLKYGSGKGIIFKPAHDPIPRKDDGGIDLIQVTDIEILSVENYHDR
ncbi:killer suppression protein HigA [bacterium]|nr:killer suppression protein HigA [bacterium]